MTDKDKELLLSSGEVIADNVVSIIETIVAIQLPALAVAWGLSKAYFGRSLKLRHKRALEFVEMIRDRPEIFTETLLHSELFQDGFVDSLETYIREKNEEKRRLIKNIFLNFSISGNQENFFLQKYYFTISQLEIDDIKVLRDISVDKIKEFKEGNKNTLYQVYGNIEDKKENIYNLIHLGILIDETGNRLGHHYQPFISLSGFGEDFIHYIKD